MWAQHQVPEAIDAQFRIDENGGGEERVQSGCMPGGLSPVLSLYSPLPYLPLPVPHTQACVATPFLPEPALWPLPLLGPASCSLSRHPSPEGGQRHIQRHPECLLSLHQKGGMEGQKNGSSVWAISYELKGQRAVSQHSWHQLKSPNANRAISMLGSSPILRELEVPSETTWGLSEYTLHIYSGLGISY